MSDIVERLRSGPIRTGDTEDGEYELFDIEEAAQTMDEAAVEIARLNAEVSRLVGLLEMSGRLMKLLETRARPDAKTEPKTNGETKCLT